MTLDQDTGLTQDSEALHGGYFQRKMLHEGEALIALGCGLPMLVLAGWLTKAGSDARSDCDMDKASGHWPLRDGSSGLPEAGLWSVVREGAERSSRLLLPLLPSLVSVSPVLVDLHGCQPAAWMIPACRAQRPYSLGGGTYAVDVLLRLLISNGCQPSERARRREASDGWRNVRIFAALEEPWSRLVGCHGSGSSR